MRVYSREQFHELVWSKPMTQLAKEFGLSDVALHKICRKHLVPNPPPGWWAKKVAGKKVAETRLPKLRDGVSNRIVIAGGDLRREPDVLAAVRENARAVASTWMPESRAPHPIVDRTIARLRKAKAGATGLVRTDAKDLIRCEIAPTSMERLELGLRRIITAAKAQGFACRAADGRVCFAGSDETLTFCVVESVQRVKHELTDAELAALGKWQRKRDRLSGSAGIYWSIQRPRFADWDYHPTGQLSIELEHVYAASSPRRTFRDGKVQRLEDMAAEIAVGIAVMAAAKTQSRLNREAARVRQEEQRRRSQQAVRAKHVEDRRAAALEQLLGELERLQRMEQLLCRLKSGAAESVDTRVAEFMTWAEDRIGRAQESLSLESLARLFEDSRLFGEDDDHELQHDSR